MPCLQDIATGSGLSFHPYTELLLCTEQRQGLHSSHSGAQPVLEAAAPAEDVCAKSEVAQDNLAKLSTTAAFQPKLIPSGMLQEPGPQQLK